jgi:hypothetical protein
MAEFRVGGTYQIQSSVTVRLTVSIEKSYELLCETVYLAVTQSIWATLVQNRLCNSQ